MRFSKIVKLFKRGSVCVTGLRGCGKDVLFGNVIARRSDEPYVSNLDYGFDYYKWDYNNINLSGNTYDNLLHGNIKIYEYPYPIGSDIYLSDCGIYFPSQYCSELNKKYPSMPMYMALSRQISHNNVHINVQNLNRAWDKIREQSDIYIMCNWCLVIFGFVLQSVTLYDKYESCVNRVKPCRVTRPLLCFDKTALSQIDIYLDNFYNQHGSVKKKLLFYRNRSQHDTYYFEKLFKYGGNYD